MLGLLTNCLERTTAAPIRAGLAHAILHDNNEPLSSGVLHLECRNVTLATTASFST
jgi:hypothetical protein